MTTGAPQRVLFLSGTAASATLRYRVRLAEEALRSKGIRTRALHFSDTGAPTWAAAADVVALYRVPLTPVVVATVGAARRRGIAVTYDIDDRVFLPEHLGQLPFSGQLTPAQRQTFADEVPRRAQAAALADRGSGASAAIVAELGTVIGGAVDLLPNGIGRAALARADQIARPQPRPDVVRLGYFSGSATHDEDWASIEGDVLAVMRSDPRVRLWLVGPVRPSPALDVVSDRVDRLAAVGWLDLFDLLAQVDLNLAPLADSPFTRGKSAIKWLEAALVRTPTVATATPPFQVAVRESVDGVLVAPGCPWAPVLAELVEDADRRLHLGRQARVGALERFGPQVQAERYLNFFTAAMAGTRSAGRVFPAQGSWRPAPLSLESYDFPVDLAGLSWHPSVSRRARSATRSAAARAVRRARALRNAR